MPWKKYLADLSPPLSVFSGVYASEYGENSVIDTLRKRARICRKRWPKTPDSSNKMVRTAMTEGLRLWQRRMRISALMWISAHVPDP